MNASRLVPEPGSSPASGPMQRAQIALRVVAVLLAVLPLTLIVTAAARSAPRETAAVRTGAPSAPGTDDARLDPAPFEPGDLADPAQD